MGVEWESISARLLFGPTTQSLPKSTASKAGGRPSNLEKPLCRIGRNLIDDSII
jgi:hypothetical protein